MEFPGGAVVRAPLLPLQGVGVQSLVGKLRSHLTRSEAKEVKKKKKKMLWFKKICAASEFCSAEFLHRITMKDALIPQQANKYFCSSFTLILKDLSCVEWISANPCASSSFLSRTFSKFQIVNFWEKGLYFLFDISYEPCTTEDTPVLLGCSVKLTTQDPCPLSQLVLASLSGQGIFIEGSL